MRVIFLEDVANKGRVGEVKEVADGYGRNYLIPNRLALLVNAANVATIHDQLKVKARQKAQSETELLELSRQLNGKEIMLKAKAGAKERLYGAVTSADIADELGKSLGMVVDKRKIELSKPIQQLGSYDVVIKLAKDILPKITVTVLAEESI